MRKKLSEGGLERNEGGLEELWRKKEIKRGLKKCDEEAGEVEGRLNWKRGRRGRRRFE